MGPNSIIRFERKFWFEPRKFNKYPRLHTISLTKQTNTDSEKLQNSFKPNIIKIG